MNIFIIASIIALVAAFLMGLYYKKQGYPFGRIFILGFISFFGIALLIIKVFFA